MANTVVDNRCSSPSPYDKIIEMIQGLNLQDDPIVMNHKIKSIEHDFCNIVHDERMLIDSMDYINDKALYDADTSLKFALLFSSRSFDSLAMNEIKVRHQMLTILEINYFNANIYRLEDKNRLYNSITLLGEYYHRVRLRNDSPVTILGKSLLELLTHEISENGEIDVKLAKLILSQVTLNGKLLRIKHGEELSQLLFHIRRNLIQQDSLHPVVKAMLLMTLDLFYSNFGNLGEDLEEMYTKYLVQERRDEAEKSLNGSIHNLDCDEGKKWSELVAEDSLIESQLQAHYESLSVKESENDCHQGEPSKSYQQSLSQPDYVPEVSEQPYDDRSQSQSRNESDTQQNRWRAPLSKRSDDDKIQRNNRRNNRRFSGSFDDDRNSVRSDGGTIKLYSVNDRLRQPQNRRSNNDNGNWDHNNDAYQNFPGNDRNRNKNKNFRNKYDIPPRFQKAEKSRNSTERDNWRDQYDDNRDYRSSSRAQTLPRPPKNKFNSHNGGNRGPSPQRRTQRNFNRNNRYNSQNSLASESSNTWERRNVGRNFFRRSPHSQQNDWDDTHSLHGQPEEDNWANKDNNIELVRNARNTTKYMKYLSRK